MESLAVPRSDRIVVPQGFRKQVQAEGPALTAEDKKRFHDAVAALSRSQPGSEGWILASKDALPVLISGCKSQKKQAERGEVTLTDDDKYFLSLVEGRIARIVTDLTAISMGNKAVGDKQNTDPHLAFLALDVLKTIGLIREIANLAKNSIFPDVRTLAVDHILDKRTVAVARGERMKIGSTFMDARPYYNSLLVDIVANGFFDDAHTRVITHISDSGDKALLQRLSDAARLPTTVALLRTRLDTLTRDRALDADAADRFLRMAFGRSGLVVRDDAPAGAEVPEGATVTTLAEWKKRKGDGKPPPPGGAVSLPAFILDDGLKNPERPPRYAYAP